MIVCQCRCVCVLAQSCSPMACNLPGSSVRGTFPGKDTGVGRYFLLQGIFLTQEEPASLCFLHWQVDSLPLPHPGIHSSFCL